MSVVRCVNLELRCHPFVCKFDLCLCQFSVQLVVFFCNFILLVLFRVEDRQRHRLEARDVQCVPQLRRCRLRHDGRSAQVEVHFAMGTFLVWFARVPFVLMPLFAGVDDTQRGPEVRGGS